MRILVKFLPLRAGSSGEDDGASTELIHLLSTELIHLQANLEGGTPGLSSRQRRELILATKSGRFGVASPGYAAAGGGALAGGAVGASSGEGQGRWVGGWGGADSEFVVQCLLRCALRCPALGTSVEQVLARAIHSAQLSLTAPAEEGRNEAAPYGGGAGAGGGGGSGGGVGGGKMGQMRLVPPVLARLESARALLAQHFPHLPQTRAGAAAPAAANSSVPTPAPDLPKGRGQSILLHGWPLVCTAPPSEEVPAPATSSRILDVVTLDVVTGPDTAPGLYFHKSSI